MECYIASSSNKLTKSFNIDPTDHASGIQTKGWCMSIAWVSSNWYCLSARIIVQKANFYRVQKWNSDNQILSKNKCLLALSPSSKPMYRVWSPVGECLERASTPRGFKGKKKKGKRSLLNNRQNEEQGQAIRWRVAERAPFSPLLRLLLLTSSWPSEYPLHM